MITTTTDYVCDRCGAHHEKRAYGPGFAKVCPSCGSHDQRLTDEAVERIAAKVYMSQQAQDAQAGLVRSKGRTCDESYCDYLDESAQEKYDYYIARGDTERAESMLARSLSEALRGNDGD